MENGNWQSLALLYVVSSLIHWGRWDCTILNGNFNDSGLATESKW